MYNNKYFEIDVYPFANSTAICEIELADENETIIMPEFIKVLREVTNDKTFSNYAFSKKIPEDLINASLLTKCTTRKNKKK